jgi:hypothetical protein
MKTHSFNLVSAKNIRDALTTLMITKPSRVLATLKKGFNTEEILYIRDNLEEVLDYMDEEEKENGI